MSNQRVIVSMPDELVAAVDAVAAEQDRSRSSVIRRMIRAATQSVVLPVVATVPNIQNVKIVHAPKGHPFEALPGNALRCVCGDRKADHK